MSIEPDRLLLRLKEGKAEASYADEAKPVCRITISFDLDRDENPHITDMEYSGGCAVYPEETLDEMMRMLAQYINRKIRRR